MYVTFLLILPSPCQADNIYIMMKCMCVCLSGFCLFCPPPAKASAGWPALALYLSLVRAREAFHYMYF